MTTLVSVVLISLILGLARCGTNSSTNMAQPYDTIVIGLGASGTMAATTLARAGKRVLALEAQNRIGGRVNTVPFGEGLVELGAEWIHGTHPSRVYDLTVQNNITVVGQDLMMEVFRSDGSLADQALLNELILYCLDVVDEPEEPEPLGQFITRKLMEYIKKNKPDLLDDDDFVNEFLNFMNLFINNYEASNDWNDVSAYTKYEELEGHQHLSWHKYGYRTLFDILLNRYNNGPGLPSLDIKLGTVVTTITWPQDPAGAVAVACQDGAVYTSDSVIVTVSLGVLKERHSSLFSPGLPREKITAIEKISIGVMDKIILSFEKPWWPRNVSFYGFVWRGEDRRGVRAEDYWTTRIFGASSPMGSNNSLTLWTSGEVAKLVETLPEDVVKSKLLALLQKFMGGNVTVPEPTGIIRSTWYSNPYTRGSYSYDNLEAVRHPDARAALARPLLDPAGRARVLFAGEATHHVHFSTVHGAVDTGYREAMRLLPHTSKM